MDAPPFMLQLPTGTTRCAWCSWGRCRPAVVLTPLQGAEYEVEDNEEWTPLHCAAHGGFLDIVHLMVNSGASTTCETAENRVGLSDFPSALLHPQVPLWYACIEGNMFVGEYLLRQPHDSENLLYDEKFTYNLMKMAKVKQEIWA